MSKWFGWLPRTRWKRWLILTAIAGVLCFLMAVTLGISLALLWRTPAFQGWVMVKMLRHQVREPAQLPPRPRLTPGEAVLLSTNADAVQSAAQLFLSTNVWDVHLKFTSNQWALLGPNTVRPVFHFMQPDGSVILRNPDATRNGLAGVFGLDYPWSEAELEFGGVLFNPVGARFKGNGTFLDSQRTYKRPFKINLGRSLNAQGLAGRTTLNFHNLTADASCVRDTLAYGFYRDAGVPASRTAFARVRLTVGGRFADALLGLYVLVENPDAQWCKEEFATDGVALFKPVTYELFKDLGEDWKVYERIYDPKTKVKARQSRRLIALAKLVTHASDADFASQVGEFVDLDEFVRFLACEVILSNYDGILSNGQNFLVYLDPRTERFGFIPWDLDHCWGEFGLVGSLKQREQASVWHPWLGDNHFLERMLGTAAIRERYRQELQRIRASLFVPERLGQQLDELVTVVRPFIAEESSHRLARFQREVADDRMDADTNATAQGQARRGYSLKHFFAARALSVSQQLEGHSQGVILTRKPPR